MLMKWNRPFSEIDVQTSMRSCTRKHFGNVSSFHNWKGLGSLRQGATFERPFLKYVSKVSVKGVLVYLSVAHRDKLTRTGSASKLLSIKF